MTTLYNGDCLVEMGKIPDKTMQIWDTPDRAFKNKYAIEADKKINDMDVEDIGEESIEHNSQHKGN